MTTKTGEKITCPRRLPTEGIFIDYDSNDILYSLMYSMATFNPKEKKLYLDKSNFTREKKTIYRCCGFTNSAMMKRHLKKLIDKGLIAEADKLFYFPYNENQKYRIISNEMLWYLASTRPLQGVRIYIMLLDWFLWKQKTGETFVFTNKDILKRLGYSTDNKVASSMVSNMLESYQREGVIQCEYFYEKNITDEGKEIPTPKIRLMFVAQKKEEIK